MKRPEGATEIQAPCLSITAKVTQMRSVDKIRLKKYVGTLNDDIIEELEKAIKLHLAME